MNVLVIAVHPDDETLGCGGTLLAHRERGDELHWLIVSRAWAPRYSDGAIRQQAQQVEVVQAAYPFATMEWLDFQTTRLETYPMNDLMEGLRGVVTRVKPEVVYLPSPFDVHSDHRVIFDAAMSVMKPFYMRPLGIRRILACEVPSETDAGPPIHPGGFAPQVFSDISGTVERKLAILKLFESEMQAEPLPRSLSSVRALARHRGATVGADYAEAFMLIREIA